MPYNPVIDSKVCRHCSVIASTRETQCRGCGGRSWGPIPDSLLRNVDPDVIRNGHGIIRLDGYRPVNWPPSEAQLRAQDLAPLPRKDPDTAAMLASLCSLVGIWGIGHIYVGKVITGLSLMIAGSIVWGIFVLLTFIGEGPVFYALGVPAWAALIFLRLPNQRVRSPPRPQIHPAGDRHYANHIYGLVQPAIHIRLHYYRDYRLDIPHLPRLQPGQRIQRRAGSQRTVPLVILSSCPE